MHFGAYLVVGVHYVSIRSRRLGREMPLPGFATNSPRRVSIRSRRLGREMPHVPQGRDGSPTGFNPLPAVRPGDAADLQGERAQFLVSIRSRRLGREMLINSILAMFIKKFQSAPGG